MKKLFFLLASLGIANLFILIVAIVYKPHEPIHTEIYKVFPKYKVEKEIDVEEEVFGVLYETDFKPGWYDPIVDEDIPFTAEEQLKIQDICLEYNICYELVLAIIETESGYDREATNGQYKGLMQLGSWHKVSDPYDIYQNIEAGCKYLRLLFDEYEDDATVLACYHGESDALTKTNMSYYTRKILERSEELERKHGH